VKRYEGSRRKFLYLIGSFVVLIMTASFQGEAMAELDGYVDLTYIHVKTKDEPTDGEVTDSKSNLFLQRYSLTLTRYLYPNLSLIMSGIFENNLSKSKTNGVRGEVETRVMKPLIELSLKTPPYYADLFYTRTDERLYLSGERVAKDITELYRADFSWDSVVYPEGKLDASRTNSFDSTKTFRDITTDLYSMKLQYSPLRRLTLRSRTEYQDSTNRIDDIESKIFNETGTIDVNTSFFRNRVNLSANYEYSLIKIKVTQGGSSSDFLLQVFPVSGLSAIDNSPSSGALDQNSALIDGEKGVSAGINIGLPPPGGDTSQRNMGLDFFQQREVDTFRIWIDREIPQEIADSFTWNIYTSADNQTWAFVRSVTPAAFDSVQHVFEIKFPPILARFFKVAVQPLSPSVPQAAQFSTILVTEMEALITQSLTKGDREFNQTSTSHTLNAYGRVILLDRPFVFYDTSYSLLKTKAQETVTRWSLTNGLNIVHSFNTVFSGSARVSREDFSEPITGKSEVYRSSMSLTAVPVSKLSHTLTLSWSYEKNPEGTKKGKQIFIDNVAGLYRGWDVYLNGGLGTSTDEEGIKSDSKLLNIGTQLVPHPSLTLNLNYFYNETKAVDDSRSDGKVYSRTTEIQATYTPVRSLALSFSLSRVKQESRSETLRNFTLNWNPFAGGALYMGFNYTEELRTSDNNLLTTYGPFVRWNITKKAFLEVQYYNSKSDGDTGKVTTETALTHLNMRF